MTAQMNGLVAFIIQHAEALFNHVGLDAVPIPSSPRGLAAASSSAPSNSDRLSMNPPQEPPPSSPRSYGGLTMTTIPQTTVSPHQSPPSSSNPLSTSGGLSAPNSARVAPPLPSTPASAVLNRSNPSSHPADTVSPRKVPPPVSPRNPGTGVTPTSPTLQTATSSRTLPTISPNMVNPALQPPAPAAAEVTATEASEASAVSTL